MNLEQFPSSESGKRMLTYVTPGFYLHSYVGKWLFEVMGQEMDEVRERFEELPFQAFPETATWGLRYHEGKYGISVREDLTDEERRRRIFQRRDVRTSMTPHAMERLLRNVTEFQVFVSDVHDVSVYVQKPPHPNVFDVILIGDGTAAIAGIRALLNRVKQSHSLYHLMYYEASRYESKMAYENNIRIQTSFYPRYNLPFLSLDQTWTLSGERRLSGYDSSDMLDFYPASVQIQAWVESPVRCEAGVRAGSQAREKIEIKSGVHQQTNVEKEIRTKEQTALRTQAEQKITAASFMTKMRQLNGERKLNGSRKLDGGLYIL